MSTDPRLVTSSDEELARRAQEGCSSSFDELARRFQVPLLHFLRRWSSDQDAEDLLQDTLIRAHQNLDKYRSSWRFATWLFTIARRLSINKQHRKRPAQLRVALENVEDGRPDPEQLVTDAERRDCLWDRAREVLTEPQMTATWLYYVEDMSVKQIAETLSRTPVAVKTMLFRARKKLVPVLNQLEAGEPATVTRES